MVGEHGPLSHRPSVMRTIERVPGIGAHLPDRPSWDCADPGCEERWPCPIARTRIRASVAGDLVSLAMVMVEVLDVAVSDLIHVPGEHQLYERLLAWTR